MGWVTINGMSYSVPDDPVQARPFAARALTALQRVATVSADGKPMKILPSTEPTVPDALKNVTVPTEWAGSNAVVWPHQDWGGFASAWEVLKKYVNSPLQFGKNETRVTIAVDQTKALLRLVDTKLQMAGLPALMAPTRPMAMKKSNTSLYFGLAVGVGLVWYMTQKKGKRA